MEEAMKIEHVFEEPKESKEEKQAQNETLKMATVCVGSTGTGKSSLINLFCKNQVKVGHGTNSATQKSALITSDTGHWLDSQGANDSSGVDDEKVLTDILKQLYNKNVNKIKVVWCVSGDMCREKDEFKKQAKFIKSLGNGVWNCCLIIKKKGDPIPEEIDGVLAAACRYGANISECNYKHLYGYTGLEFGDLSKDRLLRKINKTTNPQARKKELLESGYLTNAEIVTEISGKLSKLSSLDIHFENKECSKCGQIGDPRFIYAPCHTESEKYHPKPTVPYHKDGSLKSYHASTLVKYHPGTPEMKHEHEMYHPSELRLVHTQSSVSKSSTSWYHYGSWTSAHHYHSSSAITYTLFGFLGHKHKCCGKDEGSSGCTYKPAEYSCCGNNDSGCRSNTEYWNEFPCCGKKDPSKGCSLLYACCEQASGNTGCTKRVKKSWVEYTCCGAKEGSIGCKQKYSCCDGSEHSIGCKKEWNCCKAAEDNKGCKQKHECCDNDLGEEGCKERCKACQNEWGKGPGCVKTSKK
eukprot:341026_1